MTSRKKAILTCGGAVLLFAALFEMFGYTNTWRLWNIPVMSPHFADLRTITHGAVSHAQGFNPMIDNPEDPWQRRLNYPRIWQRLYSFGVNQHHTTCLGIIIIFSFLAGVCIILPNANNKTIALVFAAVLSPATLLGVERGNIDLLLFFFVCLSVLAIQRSYILSVIAVMIGFFLKLFPIFGCAVLLKAERSKFLFFISAIIIAVILYSCVYLPDILLIGEGTPRNAVLSYGMNVFWMYLSNIDRNIGACAKLLTYLFILVLFFLSFLSVIYHKQPSIPADDRASLDSFRAGAAIYIGTFFLGNNWDYRLVFLILVIPQLIRWSEQAAGGIAVISKMVIPCIYMSFWYLMIIRLLHYLPHGVFIGFVLDEMCNWMIFAGLLYLFFESLPIWVRALFQKMYSFKDHK